MRSGETGFLAPPGDSVAFTDHVRQLVQDGDLRRQLGLNAYHRAQETNGQADREKSNKTGFHERSIPRPTAGTQTREDGAP